VEVLTERRTLDHALAGRSISRFGDGELRNAIGNSCSCQAPDQRLAAELQSLLHDPRPESLVCIPRVVKESPRRDDWLKYVQGRYGKLYGGELYGSAFITRPDNAPWIDTPDFWSDVRRLWDGKLVTLVLGSDKSLTEERMPGAAGVVEVRCARRDAYAAVDEIEEEIGRPSGPVILCLGPTATVLAERLARKGVHALDLGHIGMFMRHAGAYAFTADDLASREYRAQLAAVHARTKGWGGDGGKHVAEVARFAEFLGVTSLLDYGAGRGALKDGLAKAMVNVRVMEYDAGFPGKGTLPKPSDFVVCTDMLEHVEPEKLDNVLLHQYRIAGQAAYFVIATRPANQTLPDGRNAHLSVHDEQWWIDKLRTVGWTINHTREIAGHEVALWLRK